MGVPSLIERWLPAPAIGAESMRERGVSSALPAVNFLHVWWARRPLTSSRAALVASLLPAWPTDDEVATSSDSRLVRSELEEQFPGGEPAYRAWFTRTLGILGDPVAGRRRIETAKLTGTRLEGNGYGYSRAFQSSPSSTDVALLHRLAALGRSEYSRNVLDPFAGGGSIPFEAVRYGCDVVANELNPVASAILAGTVSLPMKSGLPLAALVRRYGARWTDRITSRLSQFFPLGADETGIVGYVWAHAIPCPETGYPTPLIPSSWISNNDVRRVAVQVTGDRDTGAIKRRLLVGAEASAIGPTGTYKGGKATSIFTGQVIDAAGIRAAAQNGDLSEILLAVVTTRPGNRGRVTRLPSEADFMAVAEAQDVFERRRGALESAGFLPFEAVPPGEKTDEPRRMGLTTWVSMFTPRQALGHATALEELGEVVEEARQADGDEAARVVSLYLGLALDKSCDYNSRLASWHSSRERVRNTFDRHDFSFKHTFSEIDGARALYQFGLDRVVKSVEELVELIGPGAAPAKLDEPTMELSECRVIRGSAAELDELEAGSVDALVTDPPYYDNVMYGECSDFFYVWLKRALRGTWPEFCELELTDKQAEAVANPSLYLDLATHSGRGNRALGGKTARELADEHYERMLRGAWREAHRVLRDDGVMTVMFTHKRVDAWDTLGASLLDAGFSIESSWPVRTESEHSLHQAKKNSASSTIFLACRRRGTTESAFFSDLRPEIQRVAREAATRFAGDGLTGIDLTLATYGPVLSVLSRRWPVYTGQLDAAGKSEVIRPDQALILAYEEVARLKKRALLGGKDTAFDPCTDWYLTAWNDFQAAEFPAGEALKLSLATHIELDDVEKARGLVATKSGSATLQTPAQRVAAGKLDPDADDFPTQIDRLHALMYLYEHDGLQAARTWLARHGWADDQVLRDVAQAAGNAVPRVQDKDGFVRDEARILDGLAATLFPDVVLKPVEVDEPGQQVLELT